MARIIGVRCIGERHVTFAHFAGNALRAGQRVRIRRDADELAGLVVIAPDQLLEYHGPEPRARAEIDDGLEAGASMSESADLLRSLNIPDALLKGRR